jgi:hypothetical protein
MATKASATPSGRPAGVATPSAAEKKVGKEFPCYAMGGKSPEQAAIAQFAKDKGLSVPEVEAGYVPEIVSQPEGALGKMVARMKRK